MKLIDKIVDKLIRFKHFNLMFWCIALSGSLLFGWWFINGLYKIIEEFMK